MKPIIGIVARTKKNDIYNKYNIIINDNIRRSVITCGGIPISVLPTQNIGYEQSDGHENAPLSLEEQNDIIRIIKMCDGIILQGGYYSYYYDEFIAKYCIENDIPILGICLGTQILAAVDCNTSRVKNTKLIDSKIDHNDHINKYVHDVNIDKNSYLYKIINVEKIPVNSRHKYEIINLNSAIVSAKSDDEIIEAIEFPNKRFAIGLQWHPEDLYESDTNILKIFKEFIKKSIK